MEPWLQKKEYARHIMKQHMLGIQRTLEELVNTTEYVTYYTLQGLGMDIWKKVTHHMKIEICLLMFHIACH